MNRAKRILVISSLNYDPIKMFFQIEKLQKGLVRLGNDVKVFNYTRALRELSRFKGKTLTLKLYKNKTDKLLFDQIKYYEPDIVFVSFARGLDQTTIQLMRQAAPSAVFAGTDGDPWPRLHPGRIETARELDIIFSTNDGQWLQDYRDAGISKCFFMPNACDPDIERRYEVADEWRTDLLWIGGLSHHADKSFTLREDMVSKLAKRNNCKLYGCFGNDKIGGMDFLYALSGARIGVSINAYDGIRLCHSDRLTRFLSCGTMVLTKRFPDCELLYHDKEHLRYFDTEDEFFKMADSYLANEQERKKIADAGMKWVHDQFNCSKIAGYMLDLIEKGDYNAPWK